MPRSDSVSGLTHLSTARSSASRARSNADTPTGRRRKPKKSSRQATELEELKEALSAGKAMKVRGQAGNFGAHNRRRRLEDSQARRGGREHSNRHGSPSAQVTMKITYGDTMSALPSTIRGRVKGSTYGDSTARTVTVASSAELGSSRGSTKIHEGRVRLRRQVGKQGSSVLPRGAAKKMLAKTNVKATDKKGRRYHTGDPNDRRLKGGRGRRTNKYDRKYKKKSNNFFTKKFNQLKWKLKRWAALRNQNRIPVILGERGSAVAEALSLTQKQLQKLRAAYQLCDFGLMGTITYEELFEFIGEPRSKFTDALYDQILAKATGGELTLEDFVVVTVLYCMYSRMDILRLVFNMFDKDSSGTIDEGEFMTLCAMVNDGAPVFPGNFTTALENFDVNDDGLIDFNEFKALNLRFPLVLFPAFRLQEAIQQKTLGEAEWLKVNEAITAKRRREDYMAKHGGAPPPENETAMAKVCKALAVKCGRSKRKAS